MEKSIKFLNKEKKEFQTELRDKVEQFFTDKKISKQANAEMVIKTISLFAFYFGCYALIMTGWFPLWGMLLLCIGMGFGMAGIGMAISHDAIHGAYSKNPLINKILGYSMNVIGGSSYVWKITHNVIHHTWTNIQPHDEDLESTKLMRLGPKSDYLKMHKYQYLYFPLVYGVATLFWVTIKDFKIMAQKSIGPVVYTKRPWKEIWIMTIFKLIHWTYSIVFPLIFLNITWQQFLIGFLAMHFISGTTLGVVFQLAHVVEKTEFPNPDINGKLENSFYVHQMLTTSNFARKSAFCNWYMGGLNYQIEHHLFPDICSVHYPKLSHLVKEIADKHGVPYNEYKTFWQGLSSHVRVLKYFGTKESIIVESEQLKAA